MQLRGVHSTVQQNSTLFDHLVGAIGIDRPSRAAEIRPLGLSSIEKADLIAFLETLTGRPDLVLSPVLPR